MTSEAEVGGRLETPRAAGIARLLFSALFVVSILLLKTRPAPGAWVTAVSIVILREARRLE